MKKTTNRVLKIERNGKYITIVRQSHRGNKFSVLSKGRGSKSNEFLAKNNVLLYSISFPAVYRDRSVKSGIFFATRGDDHSKDTERMECNDREYELIQEAVDEYNRFFEPRVICTLSTKLFEV